MGKREIPGLRFGGLYKKENPYLLIGKRVRERIPPSQKVYRTKKL